MSACVLDHLQLLHIKKHYALTKNLFGVEATEIIMESTLLHNISAEELLNLFKGLQNQINELKQKFEPKEPVELLTTYELVEILKCDRSTIHNWCKQGKIIPYGIGNRVYFKRSELEASLVYLGNRRKAMK